MREEGNSTGKHLTTESLVCVALPQYSQFPIFGWVFHPPKGGANLHNQPGGLRCRHSIWNYINSCLETDLILSCYLLKIALGFSPSHGHPHSSFPPALPLRCPTLWFSHYLKMFFYIFPVVGNPTGCDTGLSHQFKTDLPTEVIRDVSLLTRENKSSVLGSHHITGPSPV